MTEEIYVVKFKGAEEFINIINKIKSEPQQTVLFGEYTLLHLKQLKLQDFKRYKVKITEKLLQGEGFNYIEINKILGRTELKKLETLFEEDNIDGLDKG